MLNRCLCLLILLSGMPLVDGVSAGDVVSDFELQDFRGKRHRLSDYAAAKIVVLAFVGTECPLVKLYGPRLQRLSQEYSSQGVVILGLNSNRQDSLTDMAAYGRRHGITFPLLKDVRNKVADAVAADRTPSVVVLDEQRRIQYRGRIDNQYGVGYSREAATANYLQDAVTALLDGQTPELAQVAAEGCLIGRVRKVDETSTVTYGSHIAAILNKHCVECHRDGEIAPFSLTNFEEVAGWAEMILEVVRDQRMPPWHANPEHGDFANARGLSSSEKEAIHQWVLAGAPAGDLSAVSPIPPKASGWQLKSAPDVIVAMQESFTVPAEGIVEYKYFEVDPGFTEDKWVRAAEVIPGTRDVVHHVLVFARTGKRDKNQSPGAGGGSFLAAYVPGLRTAELPQGMAKLVPAGSKLIFQMHYTPVGEERTDQSSIGLYFADDEDVDQMVITQETTNRKFSIPPNEPAFRVEKTSAAAPVDLKLLALMPHMHLRGKSFRYDLQHVDGTQQTLLDVPAYDFNWQTAYRLQQPITLRQGTQMLCVAHFDNSSNNLNNPDPSATVKWGDQTSDEMMIGYFDVAVPRPNKDEASLEVQAIMKQFDTNSDGRLQQAEVPKRHQALFARLDRNGDKVVTLRELRRLSQAR